MAELTANESKQHGSGLFPTLFGTSIILVFLLFGTQLMINLHATSVITASGFDAARDVAESVDPALEIVHAEDVLRARLGNSAKRATINWDLSDPNTISLNISMQRPALLPPAVFGSMGTSEITRRFHVRREIVQS